MVNLFGHSARSEMCLLYLLDAFACFCAVYMLLGLTPVQGVMAEQGMAAAFAAVLAFSSGPVFIAGGLYEPAAWSQAKRVLLGGFVAGLLLLPLALLELLTFGVPLPGDAAWGGIAQLLLASVAAVALTRLGFAGACRAGLFNRRIVALREGAGRSPSDRAIEDGGSSGSFEVAFTVASAAALMAGSGSERLHAQRIWALVAADPSGLPEALRRQCQKSGVRIFSDSEFCETRLRRIDVNNLPDHWLDAAGCANEGRLDAAVRRAFDVSVSLLLLLLTLPVLLMTALAIKLDSPGPVFYRQERVGKNGKPFMLFKFRSMATDAEANGAPRWATRQDSRVTRVGRFIRLVRVDEVPQVLNVLRGDMAFVGPRPERPAFVEQLGLAIPHYHDRACVKPGITGWAQINYPYGASVEDARHKLAYDLYYVRRHSLFLDLLILIKTVRVVVFQEGSR